MFILFIMHLTSTHNTSFIIPLYFSSFFFCPHTKLSPDMFLKTFLVLLDTYHRMCTDNTPNFCINQHDLISEVHIYEAIRNSTSHYR